MPFIEEMGNASSKAQTDRIIAKYSHLLQDNNSYKSMALIFPTEGDVSVTADGKPINFTWVLLLDLFTSFTKRDVMHINNNTQANSIYQMQSTTSNASKNSGGSIKNKTSTDTVNISHAGLNANSNWQKIANNYDVTNISQNEMASMVSSLKDDKLISSTDSLYLMAPRSMNQDPDVKFDLLATTREALTFDKEHGGSAEGIKNKERAIFLNGHFRKITFT